MTASILEPVKVDLCKTLMTSADNDPALSIIPPFLVNYAEQALFLRHICEAVAFLLLVLKI